MLIISMSDDQPGFELRHLETLVAVAEEGTFGRAAQRLSYTQSAVSQQIAALERGVGVALFERLGGPRPVRPTRAGELLTEHARSILAAASAAAADMARLRDGAAGRLVVGTFQSIAVRALPPVMARLRDEAPDLRVVLQEHEDAVVLLEELGAGRLDCAFIVGDIPPEVPAELVPLGSDPFLLMSPRDERFSEPGEVVPLDRLKGVALVGQPMNRCQLLLEQSLNSHGISPEVVFRTNDNGAVQAMVRSGGCHAVMPRLTIDLDDPGVSVHDLDPPLARRHVGIATLRTRASSPAVERFIDTAIDICSQLLDPPGDP